MKLFGRRKSDNYRVAYAEVMPSVPERHVAGAGGDMMGGEAFPPYVEPHFEDEGLAHVHREVTMEQLMAENRTLRRELAALRSRISYVKTVLLSDAAVGAGITSPATPDVPSAATADDDLRRMLAELKGEIAAMHSGRTVAEKRPRDEVRAMLDELRGDIARMKAASPVPSPQDDVRAMLAELKGDIESLKRLSPGMPATVAVMAGGADGANEVRTMLEELKRDIASIRQDVPAPAAAPSVRHDPNLEIVRMLSDLKADMAAVRAETAMRGIRDQGPVDHEEMSGEQERADAPVSGEDASGPRKEEATTESGFMEEDGHADRLGALFSQLQMELRKVVGPVKDQEAGDPERNVTDEKEPSTDSSAGDRRKDALEGGAIH